MAHRMEDGKISWKISDIVAINTLGDRMRVCECGPQDLIFTRRLLPFPLTGPRWPLQQILLNTDLYRDVYQTLWAKSKYYELGALLLKTISSADRYINQNTKGCTAQAHSIWGEKKKKKRVRFVKCQRCFHLDRGGYIKAVCFVDRCHFWCGLTRLALVPGFQGWVFCLLSLHLYQQMSVYLGSREWG